MSIGIGGAGSKLASLLDAGDCTIVNVSEAELSKVEAKKKLLAVAHSSKGQFRGAGKNPNIGKTAFISISDEIMSMIKGEIVFTSTGGGTGNGVCTILLKKMAEAESILLNDSTMFVFVLPYMNRESSEFVENTISFLLDPVSEAIDSGNTGNMVLFSNKVKFETRVSESEYNKIMANSLKTFLAIPEKGDAFPLLDGHIDHEDFKVFKAKPYFNHFCQFKLNEEKPFEEQLKRNYNKLLLPPENPIEVMFLLEVPSPEMTPLFYGILDYFSNDDVAASYGVVLNESLKQPLVTVSMLYSRKPRELVEDFKKIADKLAQKKLKKSIDQFVKLEAYNKDIDNQVKKLAEANDGEEVAGVLDILKRLKKLR